MDKEYYSDKVACIDEKIALESDFTLGKDYVVVEEFDNMYCLIDDARDRNYAPKDSFKKVIEKVIN